MEELKRTCIVLKNGEVMNELHSEGESALLSLINDLSVYANRKNFRTLTKATISNNYVEQCGLNITLSYVEYTFDDKSIKYTYKSKYEGELLKHYRY